MKNTQVTKHCAVCGNPYKVKAYRADTTKYCSKVCWASRSPIRKKACLFCSKPFETYDDKQNYCSQSCAGKSRTGEKANAHKHGKAAYTKRGQLKSELAKWRTAVYQRDNYTCQKCGEKARHLHAHHIKPLADFPELALDVDNGIAVCIPCHEKIHGRKISSPGKYPKKCIDCDAKTSGKSLRCRGCSSAHSWAIRGARQQKTCPICRVSFIKKPEQVYCSHSCARKAYHSLNKTGSLPVRS